MRIPFDENALFGILSRSIASQDHFQSDDGEGMVRSANSQKFDWACIYTSNR